MRVLLALTLACGLTSIVSAQLPLPPQDLEKLTISRRLGQVMEKQPDPSWIRYNGGGLVTNNSDWEIATIEIEVQRVKGDSRFGVRFTEKAFRDIDSSLSGTLLPGMKSWVYQVVNVPANWEGSNYWAVIVSATGYKKTNPAGMGGGVFAEIARGNNAAAIDMFQKTPALLDYRDDYSRMQPIHIAAQLGNVPIMEYLVKTGAKLDGTIRGNMTALHIAAKADKPEAVSFLLRAGLDKEAACNEGHTPLLEAINHGCNATAETLLQAGADTAKVADEGQNALHLAAGNGLSSRVLQYIARTRSLIDQHNEKELSPLHLAAWKGDLPLAEALLKAGADPNGATAKGAATPLHYAAAHNRAEVAKLLLQHRVNVNASNAAGTTPVMAAVNEGSDEVLPILLAAKAKIDMIGQSGGTLMHLVALKGRTKLAAPLAQAGLPLDTANNKGETPIMIAAAEKNSNTVIEFIRLGANVTLAAQDGSTALHRAVAGNSPTSVRALLQAGASLAAKDRNGETPVDIARRLKRRAMLKDMGAS